MGVVFVMNKTVAEIRKLIDQTNLCIKETGLEVSYEPKDKDGLYSLWPYCIHDTQSKTKVYMEDQDMLHVWGGQRAERTFRVLGEMGVSIIDSF
jgi:hypothetical protein